MESVEYVGAYTLPICAFTAPDGKQFKGWSTSANGEVIDGATYNVTEPVTLYAIWEKEQINSNTSSNTQNSSSISFVTNTSNDYSKTTSTNISSNSNTSVCLSSEKSSISSTTNTSINTSNKTSKQEYVRGAKGCNGSISSFLPSIIICFVIVIIIKFNKTNPKKKD